LTAVAVRAVEADAKGCSTGVRLNVAAAPEIAPVVQEAATRWVANNPRVSNECVRVQVSAAAPADVAAILAARAGGRINVGTPPTGTPSDADVPAVWIPDSVSWIGRVQGVDQNAFDADTTSIAMSPVVLAMPTAAAQALQGNQPRKLGMQDLGPILQRAVQQRDKTVKLGMAEPRRDAASLAGAVLLHDAVVTSPAQLPALVATYRTTAVSPDQATLVKGFGTTQVIAPMSEQAVIAFDAGAPQVPLEAVGIQPAPALDYPYAGVSGKPRAIAQAADLFRTALSSATYQDIFAKKGFRGPDGAAIAGFPAGEHGVTAEPVLGLPLDDAAKIADVVSIWTVSTTASRVLALTDVTSSMASVMTLPNGQQVTRSQVVQKASVDGLKLFVDASLLGRWEYAADLAPGKDYREVVPIAPLSQAQRNKLDVAVASVQLAPNDVCGLYSTLLAAYQVMKDGYRADLSNTIVVFIDGKNNKPGSMGLDELGTEFEKLADPTKPIRVIFLGIGPDVDLTELNAIAKATGGKAFQVSDPTTIGTIFLNALLRT
jgi:hypothetical protein